MTRSALHKLGFRLISRKVLHSFLKARNSPPTLLLSDTHLLPLETDFANDAPLQILEVLLALPHHQVIILGDFIESLPLSPAMITLLPTSQRLRALFAHIRNRRDVMIIDGNHDSRALPILRNIFSTRLRKTPVQCDGIIYAHGHEAALDFSHAVDDIGQLVIPISASLRTMGFRIDDTSSSNWEIAHHLAPSGTFIIFGHTHKPELAATYANTGCFLRRGPQSLITLEGSALSLWQRKIL